ncbi:hypothetical protein F5J12DRAFT_209316 [Pisolithus orientalis]|uniref:uncharacterized protein n=1 Tax=Pisolithus orientalis TaxID=936130 RepID=UPI002225B320|nr:uncharacterized protein F5J12DRAFT_209316 [Pisolithus orientalis]KAI6002663.1 hypothetical protein F5J12DRAFT_209316 [Pisolithus orientalis]
MGEIIFTRMRDAQVVETGAYWYLSISIPHPLSMYTIVAFHPPAWFLASLLLHISPSVTVSIIDLSCIVVSFIVLHFPSLHNFPDFE